MKLTFYFDYSSPYAYLGATQVAKAAGDAELVWRPFLLGALFKAIGTPMIPMFEMAQAKQEYVRVDMHRWAAHYGVPYVFPTRFPMNTVTALRMTLQADDKSKLALALFKAYWADDRDINDKDELAAIATEAGFDGAKLIEGCADPDVKKLLFAAGDEAVARGVCGAPSFYVEGDGREPMLFWGQDRLSLVKKALGGWQPACG